MFGVWAAIAVGAVSGYGWLLLKFVRSKDYQGRHRPEVVGMKKVVDQGVRVRPLASLASWA